MIMNDNMINVKYLDEVDPIETRYSRTLGRYSAIITHKGLNKTVKEECYTESVLPIYVEKRIAQLNFEWELSQVDQLNKIILNGLTISALIDWNDFGLNGEFEKENPESDYNEKIDNIEKPVELPLQDLPEKPQEIDLIRPLKEFYRPTFNIFESIFGKQKKIDEFERLFQTHTDYYENKLKEYLAKLEAWENNCNQINETNKNISATNEFAQKQYGLRLNELKEQKQKAIDSWEKEKEEFYKTQLDYNNQIKIIRKAYEGYNLNSVKEYSKLILDYSKYPYFVSKKFDIEYNQENKVLVLDYALPSIDVLPTLKDYKLIKDEWKGYYISETQLQKNFEQTMFNITLRTLYELFYTDRIDAIDSICFNGWVNAINKSTGKRESNCILSIQVKKQEFLELDLRNVDPKTCFKSLKGVSSSKLSAITSIQPIIQITKTDKRFVDSHDVTDSIDNSTNLASMNWEDFEHLIREVFENEFKTNGGEVKVTQASRDGGVDAIAFDPDPIRGGKIVIQAKRYTNTVGVSAVRDLYGTVMNEGATKGILVTTSDYGSDSYEFAKGKPLTLLNGSNLLYLLEKHGHRAKIDIEEARRLMKQ